MATPCSMAAFLIFIPVLSGPTTSTDFPLTKMGRLSLAQAVGLLRSRGSPVQVRGP